MVFGVVEDEKVSSFTRQLRDHSARQAVQDDVFGVGMIVECVVTLLKWTCSFSSARQFYNILAFARNQTCCHMIRSHTSL